MPQIGCNPLKTCISSICTNEPKSCPTCPQPGGALWDQGIAALMITDTAYFRNPNYHGPNDRADTLDYAFMAELVRSLEHAIDGL